MSLREIVWQSHRVYICKRRDCFARCPSHHPARNDRVWKGGDNLFSQQLHVLNLLWEPHHHFAFATVCPRVVGYSR